MGLVMLLHLYTSIHQILEKESISISGTNAGSGLRYKKDFVYLK